jgi:regulator of protease activity HflC (stomatin/prohibitin superfamily)
MNILIAAAVLIVAFYLFSSVIILREYERGVIFRLGRALTPPKGPGLILVFRPFDQIVRIRKTSSPATTSRSR